MKLEDIGFYTLENYRALQCSSSSPLWRCELLVTGLCNFKCPYCRGSRTDEDIPLNQAIFIINKWADNHLQNIRFSGGEPMLYKDLDTLVTHSKNRGIKRIAISTNGSANIERYKHLIKLGVNDFSISLDACCSSFADKMSGINGQFDVIVQNIKELSKLTYVTVGCVFTDETLPMLKETIEFASNLGVADIRIISSAQNDITPKITIDDNILQKHPILKYRVNNFNNGKNVRGLKQTDSHTCWLVLDDMAVEGNYHYPCIIHLRETKKAIGKMDGNIRTDRERWVKTHDCYKDEVCRKNCLDVCVDYNNLVNRMQGAYEI
jgi:molybdenum cofactor biosynthesis enzyme MoaA